MSQDKPHHWRIVALFALVVGLTGYYLSWINNSAAALSFNAYDLAEWVSLYPPVRGGSLPFLAPFLLRVLLGGLALLFLLCALRFQIKWPQIGCAVLALWLAITLLPPLEFFRGAWDDPNYRQQFALAIGTLIGLGTLVAVARRRPTWLRWLEVGIGVLTIASAVIGFILAQEVVRSLRITAPLGIGLPVMVIGVALAVVAAWQSGRSSNISER